MQLLLPLKQLPYQLNDTEKGEGGTTTGMSYKDAVVRFLLRLI